MSAQPTATSDEMDDAQLELAGVIDAVRAVPGFERFATKPELQDLRAAAEELPIIYIAPAERGGVAFVVLASEEATRTCWLPEVTEQAVAQKVDELHRAYSHRLRDRPLWIRAFESISGWLWNAIVVRLVDELPEADAAIVVPAGPLGLLPIHAASMLHPSVAGGRRFAIDELSLSYVPNTRALLEARAIAAEVADHTLLAVDEPRPVDAPALPLSHAEVLAACAVFPERRVLRFENAALDDVLGVLASVRRAPLLLPRVQRPSNATRQRAPLGRRRETQRSGDPRRQAGRVARAGYDSLCCPPARRASAATSSRTKR